MIANAELNSRRSWGIVALLFVFSMINQIDKLVLGVAAVPIMKEMNLSPGQFGTIASSFFSLYAISGLLVGLFLATRLQTKWLIVGLVAIWTVAQLPVVFGGSMAALVFGRVLLGIGEGPATPSAYEATYGWFGNDRRNLPTAVLFQGISLGLMIGGPMLTYTIAGYGWRAGFVLCGVLGFAWLLLWVVLGRDGPLSVAGRPTRTADPAGAEPGRIPWRRFWLDPTMVGVLISASCAYWLSGVTFSWLPAYLQLGLGYDARTAGWLVSVILGANLVLIFVISWGAQRMMNAGLSSRVSRGWVVGVGMLLSGACMYLATSVSDDVLRIVLLTLAFELPQVSFVFGPAIVGEIAPRSQRATAILITFSVITITAFVSPIVMGYVVEAAGTAHALDGYTHGLWIVAGVLAFGGVAGCLLLNPEATLARFAREARPMAQEGVGVIRHAS